VRGATRAIRVGVPKKKSTSKRGLMVHTETGPETICDLGAGVPNDAELGCPGLSLAPRGGGYELFDLGGAHQRTDVERNVGRVLHGEFHNIHFGPFDDRVTA